MGWNEQVETTHSIGVYEILANFGIEDHPTLFCTTLYKRNIACKQEFFANLPIISLYLYHGTPILCVLQYKCTQFQMAMLFSTQDKFVPYGHKRCSIYRGLFLFCLSTQYWIHHVLVWPWVKMHCRLRYAKRSLMSQVIVIPTEGRARGAAPALLLVWHRLFRIFWKKKWFWYNNDLGRSGPFRIMQPFVRKEGKSCSRCNAAI